MLFRSCLGIGSNMGDKHANLDQALEILAADEHNQLVKVSASMFTGTVAQKRLLKEPFLRFIPIPKFWSGLSTAAIRTTSNSVSRLISLQSMRPNISRFCKKSSATKIFGRIWTASFTTRKRSRKRAMLQRFPAPQRCPTRFLCRVLSSRGQSAHTPAPLVRSAQLG